MLAGNIFFQITSLDPVNEDPSYENLRELYADNNLITSILPLEGSKFINSFVALSLRNNKLKSVSDIIQTLILWETDLIF